MFEPSVISINKYGTVWTTTVYMKYLNTPQGIVVRNYFSTTANGVNFARGQLPIPANYTRSGDPLMAHK